MILIKKNSIMAIAAVLCITSSICAQNVLDKRLDSLRRVYVANR
jgi:hypothetical protein